MMPVLCCAALLSAFQDPAAPGLTGVSVLRGDIPGAGDLSGAAFAGALLAVASDEDSGITLLRPADFGSFEACGRVPLAADGVELDLEDLAAVPGPEGRTTLFALGSHSLVRPRVDEDRPRAENEARLREVRRSEDRERLFRCELDADGRLAGEVASISLRPILERDPLLAPFLEVPSKENGVDLEGLAWHEGFLYAGCRGPVLRGGYVPVLKLRFEAPDEAKRLLVPLDGLGIRGMLGIPEGILLLAGPVNDLAARFALYLWDGGDGLPGDDAPASRPRPLGGYVTTEGAPEGLISIAAPEPGILRLLVVHDGDGRLMHWDVELPGSGR